MDVNGLLDVIFRWAHLIAGIMWVGNSMLFNWLDRNLEKRAELSRLSQGKIFMVHSGAFYDVEKKLLEPGELPDTLHWFKWQNFTTWATGISLFIVVYYMGKTPLVDPAVKDMSTGVAITLSVCALFTAWLIYDGLWRTLGERNPRLATAISIALLFGSIFAFAQVFNGPAAYMQTGVMIGTLMTGNVWMVIVPSQRALVEATRTGKDQDPSLSIRAKQRSIHNNYLTFPLLFIMLSNHFPAATGHALNWLVLIAVMIGGAGVRHFMNVRYLGAGKTLANGAWLAPAILMGTIAVTGLLVITRITVHTGPKVTGPVPFSRAQEIIVQRCMRCHSTHPSDDVFKVAPNNVTFDTPDQIRLMKDRILQRAVQQRTMPLVNKTQMTDMERAELGAWIEQGAKLQ
ncbi:MAG TPA: urate hydroxylase PuuD [Kofleriaceae bacterium]